ncbi:uncharacterized protein BDV14DRAFT_203075 [Aspergillus stella-maris]|uniref:uncharacterized protein n=1 Tax=Aspergillus stella-maris TaxID=1810926 RepID=UPI003CCCCCBE
MESFKDSTFNAWRDNVFADENESLAPLMGTDQQSGPLHHSRLPRIFVATPIKMVKKALFDTSTRKPAGFYPRIHAYKVDERRAQTATLIEGKILLDVTPFQYKIQRRGPDETGVTRTRRLFVGLRRGRVSPGWRGDFRFWHKDGWHNRNGEIVQRDEKAREPLDCPDEYEQPPPCSPESCKGGTCSVKGDDSDWIEMEKIACSAIPTVNVTKLPPEKGWTKLITRAGSQKRSDMEEHDPIPHQQVVSKIQPI